jgi:hypothetical protein
LWLLVAAAAGLDWVAAAVGNYDTETLLQLLQVIVTQLLLGLVVLQHQVIA